MTLSKETDNRTMIFGVTLYEEGEAGVLVIIETDCLVSSCCF